MSGGGGGSGNSSGSGGNTNASARAAMTSNTAYSGSGISGASAGPAGGQSSGGNYSSGTQGNGTGNFSSSNDNRENYSTTGQYANTPQNLGTVDAEDEYMSPDRDHYNQTQKEITQAITGLGDNNQSDWSDLSKVQQEQYQLEMNKVKGTEGKNYSFYSGNEGTINNTFAENWKDAVVTSPALKYSPTLRFLSAAGKTVKQNATTSYGTGDYGSDPNEASGMGQAVDQGGWLGKISSGQASQDFIGTPQGRDAMNEIAPHAPYMISGITKPTNSPAANWYANLGTTPSNPGGFNLATEYATAKAAISTKLQSKGPIGMLAVSDSPFYDWLKTNKLDKGIL